MDMSKIKEEIPFESPIDPVALSEDSEFQFDCHPGISCFNQCCKSAQIQLLPYDILRLKRRLDMSSHEFVARCTKPFEMDFHGLPGLRLATKPDSAGECAFLGEEECTVYEDRPTACRYYALGFMGMRKAESPKVEDGYFVVKEAHCKGHEEPKKQTVAEYRKAQGVEVYDRMNREWLDIIIKKKSSGPTVGAPSARSVQLFDMCSYDMDSFGDFLRTEGFQRIFDLDEVEYQGIREDEDARLRFALRFLKQVLFGEQTIPIKEGAREERLASRRNKIQDRLARDERNRQDQDDVYKNDTE